MEEIVVVVRRRDPWDPFLSFLQGLFPECELRVAVTEAMPGMEARVTMDPHIREARLPRRCAHGRAACSE